MELECMKACMRKLAIWYTPNFKPITTHDELDRIMSTLGFTPLPPVSAAVSWKEYSFPAAGTFPSESPSPPLPRIPYPRIDGLHVSTYRSFLESVNFYLRRNNISDVFHIRGVPLHHGYDRSQKWLRMARDDLVYVYREGTLDTSATGKDADNDQKDREGTMNIEEACTSGNIEQDADFVIVPWKNIMDRTL